MNLCILHVLILTAKPHHPCVGKSKHTTSIEKGSVLFLQFLISKIDAYNAIPSEPVVEVGGGIHFAAAANDQQVQEEEG